MSYLRNMYLNIVTICEEYTMSPPHPHNLVGG